MIRSALSLVIVLAAVSSPALGGQQATEDFETGYTDGQPLRIHEDWFFEEQNVDPTCRKGIGLKKSWGVASGDRAFTWTAKPFRWNDPQLVSVTMGGDWQTDSSGRLDDDRAGWSISKDDDSSDNIFGVQIDPVGDASPSQGVQILGFQFGGDQQPPELNIEAYWDGDTLGDDGCRTSMLKLPGLKPDTWYRLRAKFTKLTTASARIDVTFVELDDAGDPTGEVHKAVLEDTAALPDTEKNEMPNPAYFNAPTVWPVFKNYRDVEGGFDNAVFEIKRAEKSTESETSGD